MQRLLAAKGLREMARALILDRVLGILLGALLYLVGLGMFAYFQVFPERLAQELPGTGFCPFTSSTPCRRACRAFSSPRCLPQLCRRWIPESIPPPP